MFPYSDAYFFRLIHFPRKLDNEIVIHRVCSVDFHCQSSTHLSQTNHISSAFLSILVAHIALCLPQSSHIGVILYGLILDTSDILIQSSYLSGNSSQSMDVLRYLSRQPFHSYTDRPQNMCYILRTYYCEVAPTYVSSGENRANCGDSWGSTPFSPARQWRCSRLGSTILQ